MQPANKYFERCTFSLVQQNETTHLIEFGAETAEVRHVVRNKIYSFGCKQRPTTVSCGSCVRCIHALVCVGLPLGTSRTTRPRIEIQNLFTSDLNAVAAAFSSKHRTQNKPKHIPIVWLQTHTLCMHSIFILERIGGHIMYENTRNSQQRAECMAFDHDAYYSPIALVSFVRRRNTISRQFAFLHRCHSQYKFSARMRDTLNNLVPNAKAREFMARRRRRRHHHHHHSTDVLNMCCAI